MQVHEYKQTERKMQDRHTFVPKTPIELGELGREEETKNVANCADNETTAKADDEKKNNGKDDSESDGNEIESDESIMNDGPFFKFVRAIVNKFMDVHGGNSEDLSTFFGYALRIVVETPIELGELGREEETKNVANCADNETTAKAGDEKKNDGKDDSESDGNESESDESIMNDGPFFKFIRAIVNNFLELSTGRTRHGRIPDDESCVKRTKFCAKFRAKIFNDWSWEDNFFDELFNTYTGEVLRILRIPVTDDGHASDADAKFVLHDVFVLRCAREEMDTLASDLNALFAPDQFDCRVICVEKPPEKVAKYL
ncbi:hypothetical protein GPALN_012177 [Globodera pallida]|nr:hypothetical protein GPALN_012177 [Globodera pallida]